jgi:two-component system chemotaxis response regulator CheY
MKILLVEDSNTMRYMISKMLNELGYSQISIATSAEDAIPMVQKETFNLIFLDWNLPRMSGFDYLKYIKNIPVIKEIPVIMLTTVHDRESIISAFKAGACSYILKPVTIDILDLKISEIAIKLT